MIKWDVSCRSTGQNSDSSESKYILFLCYLNVLLPITFINKVEGCDMIKNIICGDCD